MRTKILASKTGKMNIGSYSKEKTAQVYTISFVINGVEEEDKCFRFGYVHDIFDECFNTLEEAMNRFNEASKLLN